MSPYSPLSPAPRPSRGFTLQETLIALCIGGSLTTGGVAIWTVVHDSAMTAAANDIAAHLALARSEAIKRHVPVKLCPSRDQTQCSGSDGAYTLWHHGWLVYADENGNGRPEADEILRTHAGAPGNIVIRTSRTRSTVIYQPIGTSGGSTLTFAVCDSRDAVQPRYVTVSNAGRARVSRTTTSAVQCARA